MKAYITAEQAMSVIPDNEYVHTFVQMGMALMGTDYRRDDLEEKMQSDEIIELAGKTARSMHHGICIYSDKAKHMSELLFVETDEEKLKALEAQLSDKSEEENNG